LVDRRLLAVAAAIGTLVGLFLSPVVLDGLLRWGIVESVVECVRAPCPYEASSTVTLGVTVACLLAGAVGGLALAGAVAVAGQHKNGGGSVGSQR